MTTKGPASGIAAGLIGLALSSSPAFAQITSPPPVTNPPPSPAQITSFATGVGVNATCARAYVAANNSLPQTLGQLTQFMVLAPAADLCSPGAIASAQNNAPAPTDAQISSYSQSLGVNATCIHAFVLHANSFPQNPAELNQFQLAAPASDLCTPAAVSNAQH